MPAHVDHEHAWRPSFDEVGRYVCACGDTGRRQRDGSILTSIAAVDPDDIVTARPTDDETINEHGRRIAMTPDELRDRRWPDELALDF